MGLSGIVEVIISPGQEWQKTSDVENSLLTKFVGKFLEAGKLPCY